MHARKGLRLLSTCLRTVATFIYGSNEYKLSVLFRMFDMNKSGFIELQEFAFMVCLESL